MTKQLESKFYAAGVIDTDGCCERVSDDEAQFWTVYERQRDGTSQAICDCDSRSGADAAADRFNALIAALEQSQQYAKQRDEENQDLMLTVGRLRVERAQLETIPMAVKLPESFYPDGDIDCPKVVEVEEVIEAIRAAGGTVEGE